MVISAGAMGLGGRIRRAGVGLEVIIVFSRAAQNERMNDDTIN